MSKTFKIILITLITLLAVSLIVLAVISAKGGIFKKERQKEELPPLSYKINESVVNVELPRFGVVLNLDPGWRVFTATNLPTDVSKTEFADILYGQTGIRWFVLDDGFVTPFAYYMLVSPEHWSEIVNTESDKLALQFGYLGQPPKIVELLQEIDVIVLGKERGQSLEQFMETVDNKGRLDAEKAYSEGRATREHLEGQRKGFFGNFESKEVIPTALPEIQSLLLSERTTPPLAGTGLFLLFSCTEGDKVIVFGPGPFSSGKIDYLSLFRSLSQRVSFTENFCK